VAERSGNPNRTALVSARNSIEQEARRWGVHHTTIRTMIADGTLPYYRLGRVIRLDPDEVDGALRALPIGSGG
jgi:excisionase family DNA binding protein